ncbi:TM2 domain-containing protein [uncultured Arthrobacter sp.]|uniref:TM2 domain-containing protein n=1 Tax=uncultured Arthrobacter sp. TaxID=114050 RepID=UPI0025E7C85F|nr:TM2 domain-containing protein [uncultured Arthrobacter sp.]
MSTTPDQPRSESDPVPDAAAPQPDGYPLSGGARKHDDTAVDPQAQLFERKDNLPDDGDAYREPAAPSGPRQDPYSQDLYSQDPYAQGSSTQDPSRPAPYGEYQPSPYEQNPYQGSQYPQGQFQQGPPPGGQYPAGQFQGQFQGQYPQGQPYGVPGYPYGSGYPEQKSRLVAGLLGILLGSLGIHRFYLGYVGIGIAQIAVTIVTFGLGAVWGFIEGIMILVGAESFRRDAKGVPLKE